MATVCIVTATYNRAHTLNKLYESLLDQTSKDFSWLVVDDGSTDDTEKLICSYIDEGKITIRYLKQPNGGKQRALNNAALHCTDELFFAVDSDDWCPDYAVEAILNCWRRVKDDKRCAGVIGLHKVSPAPFPNGLTRTNTWDLYEKWHFKGDSAQVYRTETIKAYPYPVVEGEKFISECIVYNEIAKSYDVELINKVLIEGDYLPDGYTASWANITKNNPKGYCLVKKQSAEMAHTLWRRFYETTLFLAGCELAGNKDWFRQAPNKPLAIAGKLPAHILRKMVFR